MFVVMLAVQGVIFVVWAFVAFRTLIRLYRNRVAVNDQTVLSTSSTVAAFRTFFRDPALRADRRILALLTLILFVANLATLWAMPQQPG